LSVKQQQRAWTRSSVELKSENAGMLISQKVTICLTITANFVSRASSITNHVGFLFIDFGLLRKVFTIYRWRSSFGFECSVSSALCDKSWLALCSRLTCIRSRKWNTCSSSERELGTMTLTFELDLDRVEMNLRVKYRRQVNSATS